MNPLHPALAEMTAAISRIDEIQFSGPRLLNEQHRI